MVVILELWIHIEKMGSDVHVDQTSGRMVALRFDKHGRTAFI